MHIIALIPARMNSTRFPGKPLALLRGKPMIQHVYEQTQQVEGIDFVIVATPDTQIAEVVWGFGGNAVITRADNATGTDAIAEVARAWTHDIIVNVQGDLPYFHPVMVEEAIAALIKHPHRVSMATVKTPINSLAEWYDPNVVKVVTRPDRTALYFSRSPFPFQRDTKNERPFGYRHIGVYVYWRTFLMRFSQTARTPLEQLEQLEQLRVLEHGYKIVVTDTAHPTLEVDTPEDLQRAEKALIAWGK